MRLFDKVCSQAKSTICDFKKRPPDAVLCADAIASHVYETPKDPWLPNDYPFAIPPWESVFVEWNMPKTLNIHGKIKPLDDGARQAGVSISAPPALTRKDIEYVTRFGSIFDSEGTDPTSVSRAVYGRFFVSLRSGELMEPDAIWLCFMDRHGTYLGSGCIGPDAERATPLIATYKTIVMLSFTFANCCNVKLEDVTDDVSPIPKIIRRLKIPEVKRYTLNIAGHVARPSRDYNEGQQGVMPFHLCRGHFATYTADKPMFGNPKLVGRYWHPPHMKGKKENGEIVKDYAIAKATHEPREVK